MTGTLLQGTTLLTDARNGLTEREREIDTERDWLACVCVCVMQQHKPECSYGAIDQGRVTKSITQ